MRNNKELIRSVNRAKNITTQALRSAVIVSKALYSQRGVMNQVNAVNDVTNNLIGSTSRLLKEQGVEIQKRCL